MMILHPNSSQKNMISQILSRLCIVACFLATSSVFAEPVAPLLPATPATASKVIGIKPAAIVYFNNGTSIEEDHAAVIKSMVKEASTNLGMRIEPYPLTSENELVGQIEKIADTEVGLIVIVEPHNIETLSKIPSLYPDIHFTIIGASKPLYLTNVRSIAFKEPEGVFMMGVLAALHSKAQVVSFLSKDNNENSRNLAYAFLQGIKYANADVQIVEQLGKNATRRVSDANHNASAADTSADIVFVLDEDLLEMTLKNARHKKQLVITYNHSLTGAYPGLVLTSLLNHYDLAVYHTLRSYMRNEWRSGSESMGIGNSYIDYVLDTENRTLLPKGTIEQIEMVKDFVSQGVIQVNTLQQ